MVNRHMTCVISMMTIGVAIAGATGANSEPGEPVEYAPKSTVLTNRLPGLKTAFISGQISDPPLLCDFEVHYLGKDKYVLIARDAYDKTPVMVLGPTVQVLYDLPQNRIVIIRGDDAAFWIRAVETGLNWGWSVGRNGGYVDERNKDALKEPNGHVAFVIDVPSILRKAALDRSVARLGDGNTKWVGYTANGGKVEAIYSGVDQPEYEAIYLYRPAIAEPFLSITKIHINVPAAQYTNPEIGAINEFFGDLNVVYVDPRADSDELSALIQLWGRTLATRYAIDHPESRSAIDEYIPETWDRVTAVDQEYSARIKEWTASLFEDGGQR